MNDLFHRRINLQQIAPNIATLIMSRRSRRRLFSGQTLPDIILFIIKCVNRHKLVKYGDIVLLIAEFVFKLVNE